MHTGKTKHRCEKTKSIKKTYPLYFRFIMDLGLVGSLVSEPSDDIPEESEREGKQNNEFERQGKQSNIILTNAHGPG